MKKKLLIMCFSIVLLLCISGCNTKENNKNLTCIQQGEDNGLTIKIDMKFKNNKLDEMNTIDTFDLSKFSSTDEEINSLIKDEDACKELGLFEDSYKTALLTCKAEVNNGKLSIDTSYDVNKIEDSIIKSDKSYSNIKKYFEMQGLTCK